MTPCDNNGRQPYEVLAEAVVAQAVKDFRRSAKKLHKARAKLQKDPENERSLQAQKEAVRMLRDVTSFFRGKMFRMMYELDGEEFLQRLREECDL